MDEVRMENHKRLWLRGGFLRSDLSRSHNSEIVLDRPLADARIFLLSNLLASGTRKEELLHTENEMKGTGSFAEAMVNL